jgi:hypothetical protein
MKPSSSGFVTLPRALGVIAVVGALGVGYLLGRSETVSVSTSALLPSSEPSPSASPLAKAPRPWAKRPGFAAPQASEAASEAPAPTASVPEPPAPEMTAREHRDKSIAEIRASGAEKNLATPAAAVVAGWTAKLADFGVGAKFSPFECYAKGCFVTGVFASEPEVDRSTEVITRTGEFHGWQAGKMRSGTIQHDDGKVEITWFLFTPPAGSEILSEPLPPDNLAELRQQVAAKP